MSGARILQRIAPTRAMGLLSWIFILVGIGSVALYFASYLPLSSLFAGVVFSLFAWLCITQGENPGWRTRGAIFATLALLLYLASVALWLSR